MNADNFNHNYSVMNEQNLEYLKDTVKYLGFGEKLFAEIEKNIQQQLPEFVLILQTEYHNDKFSAQLHFKKNESGDNYFFDQYLATLEKFNGEKKHFTFHIYKGEGVTSKEAYNLLSGRAIYKNLVNAAGKRYNTWLQLDCKNTEMQGSEKLKQFHENYGFDLEKTLRELPIAEMEEPGSAKMLQRSLEKGNLQSVKFVIDGSPSLMFLEANPKYKTIKIFDSRFKLADRSFIEKCRAVQMAGSVQKNTSKSNSNTEDVEQMKDNTEFKEKEGTHQRTPKQKIT